MTVKGRGTAMTSMVTEMTRSTTGKRTKARRSTMRVTFDSTRGSPCIQGPVVDSWAIRLTREESRTSMATRIGAKSSGAGMTREAVTFTLVPWMAMMPSAKMAC